MGGLLAGRVAHFCLLSADVMSSVLFARSFVCMFELSPVSFAFVNIPVELHFTSVRFVLVWFGFC